MNLDKVSIISMVAFTVASVLERHVRDYAILFWIKII